MNNSNNKKRLEKNQLQEKQRLLTIDNGKEVYYPKEKSMIELFREKVEKYPKKTAIQYENDKVSYKELDNEIRKTKEFLIKKGVKENDKVCIFLERSIDSVVSMFAILDIGAVYVPIDISYPEERVNYIIDDTNAKLIITANELKEEVINNKEIDLFLIDKKQEEEKTNNNAEAYKEIKTTKAEELNKTEELNNKDKRKREYNENNLASIYYTSGSTGSPKGIMITERSMKSYIFSGLKAIEERSKKINENDLFCQNLPAGYIISMWQFFAPLISGARLMIYSDDIAKNPILFFKQIKKDKVSVIQTVPSFLSSYLEEFKTSNGSKTKNDIEFNDLIELQLTGEKISASTVNEFYEKNKKTKLVNLYGSTETVDDSLHYVIPRNRKYDKILAGRPFSLKTYILDKEKRLLPIGITGELYVSGKALSEGYLDNKESNILSKKNKEVFIPNPFIKTERMYKTGDLAKMHPDGNVEILGRSDNLINLRGNRIELGEIETNLKKHNEIERAVVLVKQEKQTEQTKEKKKNRKENKETLIIAYYKAKKQIKEEDLREFLVQKLPKYMIPADFIYVNDFPLNSSGKIDKLALLKINKKKKDKNKYIAPKTETEKKVAKIWQEVLNVKKVSRNDNFFNLGGSSLDGIKIINKIQATLNVTLYFHEFFSSPTISLLAKKIVSYKQKKEKNINDNTIRNFKSNIPKFKNYNKISSKLNQRAIFILSPPRSGSTLLRTILAGHSELFSPPELHLLLFRNMKERREFFNKKFDFYLDGLVRAVMELKECNYNEADEIIKYYEKKGSSIKDFYAELQNWTGSRILVDKSVYYSLHENILERIEKYFKDPLYIHLARNPYDSILSFKNMRFDQVFLYQNNNTARELAELVYLVGHQNICKFLTKIPEQRKHFLRFEDLIKGPEKEMRQLLNHFKFNYEEKILNVYDDYKRRMLDGRNSSSKMIGDPNFLNRNYIDSNINNKWKNKYRNISLYKETNKLAKYFNYDLIKNSQNKGGIPITEIDEWFMNNKRYNYEVPFFIKLEDVNILIFERAIKEIIKTTKIKIKYFFYNKKEKKWLRKNIDSSLNLRVENIDKKEYLNKIIKEIGPVRSSILEFSLLKNNNNYYFLFNFDRNKISFNDFRSILIKVQYLYNLFLAGMEKNFSYFDEAQKIYTPKIKTRNFYNCLHSGILSLLKYLKKDLFFYKSLFPALDLTSLPNLYYVNENTIYSNFNNSLFAGHGDIYEKLGILINKKYFKDKKEAQNYYAKNAIEKKPILLLGFVKELFYAKKYNVAKNIVLINFSIFLPRFKKNPIVYSSDYSYFGQISIKDFWNFWGINEVKYFKKSKKNQNDKENKFFAIEIDKSSKIVSHDYQMLVKALFLNVNEYFKGKIIYKKENKFKADIFLGKSAYKKFKADIFLGKSAYKKFKEVIVNNIINDNYSPDIVLLDLTKRLSRPILILRDLLEDLDCKENSFKKDISLVDDIILLWSDIFCYLSNKSKIKKIKFETSVIALPHPSFYKYKFLNKKDKELLFNVLNSIIKKHDCLMVNLKNKLSKLNEK